MGAAKGRGTLEERIRMAKVRDAALAAERLVKAQQRAEFHRRLTPGGHRAAMIVAAAVAAANSGRRRR